MKWMTMGVAACFGAWTQAMELLPAWQGVGDDASAAAVVRRGGGQPPVKYGDLTRKGSVELPVDGPRARVQWDVLVPCDLSSREGIEFDLRVDDLSGIKGAMAYLKSGAGWYSGTLMIEAEGAWQRVRLTRETLRGCEGQPAGWQRIDAVRIALDRSAARKTTTAGVADFRYVEKAGGAARTVVVRGDWISRQPRTESRVILDYAATTARELEQAGVSVKTISDETLTLESLAAVKVVVLPYNPDLPPAARGVLADFTARGGKIFACYSLPSCVAKALGVKGTGFYRAGQNGDAPIAGILKNGKGLAGQPAFAVQTSANAHVAALTGPGEIVAYWADGKRNALKLPALFATPTGVFMSHVWHPGGDASKRALLRAIMSSLCPELQAGFAAADAERAKTEAAVRDFMLSVPGKAGERRLAWCHSARGLGAEHDWDSSIKFLKGMGFTDMIANLSWGYDAYYASQVLPVDASVARAGDALAACRAACRKYGVKLHVWRVCYNTGGRIAKEKAAEFEKAGRFVKPFDAKSVNPWSHTFCPSHPENVALEIAAMKELAERGVDGLHFDYIRYASGDFCFCDGCRARFEQAIGKRVANWPADVRADAELARKWTDWRVGNISRVVEAVADYAHARHPGMEISVAARASIEGAYRGDGQDWVGWAKKGWVDFLCPMDYTPLAHYFRNSYREQAQAIAGTRAKLYPGLGVSCWPADGRGAERMARQIQALRADGLEGFTIFNFDARAAAVLPLVRQGPLREM